MGKGEMVRLGECFTLSSGKFLPTNKRVNGEYSVFGGNGITGKHNEYFIDKPTIVIGRVGEYCGCVHTTGEKVWVTDNALFVTQFLKTIDRDYLCYTLNQKNLNSFANKSGQPSISQSIILKIEIPLPPLETQKQIAKILDTAAELLAMYKQQLAELDNLIKSTFYDMFGDPVTNPKGWEMVPFTDVLVLQRGFDLPVQSRVINGNIPVYGSNGVLDYHNDPKIKNGGVITGRSGTIGKVHYTLNDYWPLNTTLFSVELKGNNIIYLAYLLKYFNLDRFCSGTGVPTLNRNIVHKEMIYKIPLSLQSQFAEIVTKIEEQKVLVRKAIDEMQNFFDSLMIEYFE